MAHCLSPGDGSATLPSGRPTGTAGAAPIPGRRDEGVRPIRATSAPGAVRLTVSASFSAASCTHTANP